MKTKGILKQSLLVFGLMIGAVTLFSFLMPVAGAQLLQASDQPGVLKEATGGETDLRSLVLTMVNYVLTFLGIVAVIMIIYGGVLYVTSAGNEEAVNNAKNIIKWAIIGIIIILLSFVIVNAVLGAGTGGV